MSARRAPGDRRGDEVSLDEVERISFCVYDFSFCLTKIG
jgi:hypothetical protein